MNIIQESTKQKSDIVKLQTKLKVEIRKRTSIQKKLEESEIHYTHSIDELSILKERLRKLSHQIISTQEEERKKISRDLHDVISQSLMSVNVCLATLKKQSGMNTDSFNRSITKTQRLLATAAITVHEFACGLRPPMLDDIGIIPTIQTCLIDFAKRTGINCKFTANPIAEQLSEDEKTTLFRVTQEAISNVERHSKAKNIIISLKKKAKSIIMIIKDDGISFDAKNTCKSRGDKHLGILGMRERMEMIHGKFDLKSTVLQGTKIILTIPIDLKL